MYRADPTRSRASPSRPDIKSDARGAARNLAWDKDVHQYSLRARFPPERDKSDIRVTSDDGRPSIGTKNKNEGARSGLRGWGRSDELGEAIILLRRGHRLIDLPLGARSDDWSLKVIRFVA